MIKQIAIISILVLALLFAGCSTQETKQEQVTQPQTTQPASEETKKEINSIIEEETVSQTNDVEIGDLI